MYNILLNWFSSKQIRFLSLPILFSFSFSFSLLITYANSVANPIRTWPAYIPANNFDLIVEMYFNCSAIFIYSPNVSLL